MGLRAVVIGILSALVAAGCGAGVSRIEPDSGNPGARVCVSELDCRLDEHCEAGLCAPGAAPPVDAGFLCTRDDDCPKPQQCVRSTGQCVSPQPVDAGEVDAGVAPACEPGLELSCGVSKLGECRLGTSRCEAADAGYGFSACLGDLGPQSELCDGKDNDCDGLTDEGFTELTCGVGACARTAPACVAADAGACVPGAPAAETCDGLDNDCDGNVDEGLAPLTCGVGACARSVVACQGGVPQACVPGTPAGESCNGRDDDCNGLVDDALPTLTCGQGACARSVASCSGGQAQSCTPGTGATEICNNLDDDCDGQVDEALGTVACGVGACARTVQACVNGTLLSCTPGTPAAESCNTLDDDCDGQADEGLGSISCGVGACAASVAACVGGAPQTCTPGAPSSESCDGADNDCDGQTDEGLAALTCGQGVCRRTVAACLSGVPQSCTPGTPGAELCDASGLDENCDGQVDEGCNCTNGQTRACYGGPMGTQGVGVCLAGTQTCTGGNWGACAGQVLPGTEACNGLDDDCDAQLDEGFGTISCGTGVCARTVQACASGAPQSCSPGPAGTEACNSLDDDCDGQVDEGLGTLSCGVGTCARIVPACVGGAAQTCVPGAAGTEVCDGLDNDCDGTADDALGNLSCGVGACARTVSACVGGTPQACTPGAPAAEACNSVDDDCDGQVDDGFGPVSCGVGACLRTVQSCVAGAPQACTPGAAVAESCNGADDDCDGTVDDGVCGPLATCPAPQTVNPNTTVTLSPTGSSPAGRPITCAWTVVSRPPTSSGTFTNGTSCAGAQYFADVVGVHVLRFTVTDSLGLTASCDVTITVNPLGDLWVELTWDRNNDMDLHLLHPSAGNSHQGANWKTSPYDCYYANKTPSWDAPGTADDPSLDRDDVPDVPTGHQALGPENIRVNVPATSHLYTIGVHMYGSQACGGGNCPRITNTVKVYCGGQLKATLTQDFGGPGNNPDPKDLWVVGTVNFNGAGAAGCFFTPDGFVVASP